MVFIPVCGCDGRTYGNACAAASAGVNVTGAYFGGCPAPPWRPTPPHDQDSDSVLDGYDNCPSTANLDQADADVDLVGNACDACPGTIRNARVDYQGCPPKVKGDLDSDGDVDDADFQIFKACVTGPAVVAAPACTSMDFDHDGDVDMDDFGILQRCYSGAGIPADSNCSN